MAESNPSRTGFRIGHTGCVDAGCGEDEDEGLAECLSDLGEEEEGGGRSRGSDVKNRRAAEHLGKQADE